ncbi:MAG: hypothetical protein WCG78_03025 [Candidatus Omnitrophota bacterium]
MKKRATTIAFMGALTLSTVLAAGCGDRADVRQLEEKIARLDQDIQLKDQNIKALTAQLKAVEDQRNSVNSTSMSALQAKQEELGVVYAKLDALQNDLAAARKEMAAPKPESIVIPPVSVDKNITMGQIKGVVRFDEPFDNFVGNIKIRDARFWVDNTTVFEGVTSIDDLREGDKVSISFYERGINRIATHIRLER